jgi:preprotein translocase subunit SecG
MYVLLVIIHVIVCIALILIVLLQTGKGAEMGAAFGGASQTVFGGAGPAPFLTKITTGAAIVFMITSLALAYVSSKPSVSSLMKGVKPMKAAPVAPALPAQSAPGVPAGADAKAQPAQKAAAPAAAPTAAPAPAAQAPAPKK